jgi:hypothetical protein
VREGTLTYDLTYLSFGAGVQSTALLVCSNLGLHGVLRADVAIFADTGYEPAYVYDQLRTMQAWSKIPVEVVRAKDQSGRGSFDAIIPAYTIDGSGDKGILRRQCTSNWKMEPLEAAARRHLGYKSRQVVRKRACALIGISTDEAQRMKTSRTRWIDNCYPLVDERLRREDCLRIVSEAGLPRPERSACYFCPFHTTAEWKMLRDDHPDEWQRAVEYDRSIRHTTRAGVNKPIFLHRQLVPLDEAVLDRPEENLFGDSWGNECEGMCGV